MHQQRRWCGVAACRLLEFKTNVTKQGIKCEIRVLRSCVSVITGATLLRCGPFHWELS